MTGQPDPADAPPLTAIERERIVLRHLAERGPTHPRLAGGLLFGLGMVIVAIIGAVAWFTVPVMLAGGAEVDGTRFSGGPGVRLVIFAIYALVAAIGGAAMFGGAVLAATGKRSPHLARAMVAMVTAILLIAAGIRMFGGE